MNVPSGPNTDTDEEPSSSTDILTPPVPEGVARVTLSAPL
jgi:hypothetical protein